MCSQVNEVDKKYQEFIKNFEPKQFKEECKEDMLGLQLWNSYVSKKQTKQSYESKIEVWLNLQKILLKVTSSSQIYIMGSVLNGFGLNNGDIDLTIITNKTNVFNDRNKAIIILIRFDDYIRCLDSYKYTTTLIHAKVPILRFTDKRHKVQIDLSVNNIFGVKNTYLLRTYSIMDWRVKPLVVIIKSWARKFDINSAKYKTLSSYSLTLMVIHFLQTTVPKILPILQTQDTEIFHPNSDIEIIDAFARLEGFQSENKKSLSDLLIDFFQYYTCFKFENLVISVRLGKAVQKHNFSLSSNFEYRYINIEEPFNLTNTAYAVYSYFSYNKIVRVFKKSYEQLVNNQNISDFL